MQPRNGIHTLPNGPMHPTVFHWMHSQLPSVTIVPPPSPLSVFPARAILPDGANTASAENPGISMSVTPSCASTVKVWRQLRDEEWKFLADVHPHERLVNDVGSAVAIREDYVNDLAWAAERRRPCLY